MPEGDADLDIATCQLSPNAAPVAAIEARGILEAPKQVTRKRSGHGYDCRRVLNAGQRLSDGIELLTDPQSRFFQKVNFSIVKSADQIDFFPIRSQLCP